MFALSQFKPWPLVIHFGVTMNGQSKAKKRPGGCRAKGRRLLRGKVKVGGKPRNRGVLVGFRDSHPQVGLERNIHCFGVCGVLAPRAKAN